MVISLTDFNRQLAVFLEENSGNLVIDADTHITDLNALSPTRRARYEASSNYYHGRPVSAEELVREMDMAKVDAALSWQNPAATAYTSDLDANAEALLAANRYVHDSALRFANRIIPGGWTDPKACGLQNALHLTEVCVREFGFAFVKMNPAQNHYPIDGPDVLTVVNRIIELGAIPTFHFGADTPYTPVEGLERIALEHPDDPILAIHMGGGGAGYTQAETLYQRARELGLRRPNLKFALSAKRDTHIESDLITFQLAGAPFCNNLFCASDAPYGRMTWNFGGFRAMLNSLIDGARHTDPRLQECPGVFTPAIVQNYLGGNFARMVAKRLKRKLAPEGVSSQSCR